MQQPEERTLVDDEVYNVRKAMSTKLEGLAAYHKYERDGQASGQHWQQ